MRFLLKSYPSNYSHLYNKIGASFRTGQDLLNEANIDYSETKEKLNGKEIPVILVDDYNFGDALVSLTSIE